MKYWGRSVIIELFCLALIAAMAVTSSAGSETSASRASAGPLANAQAPAPIHLANTRKMTEAASQFRAIWKPLDDKADADTESWRHELLRDDLPRSSGTTVSENSIRVHSNGEKVLVRGALAGDGVLEPSGLAVIFNPATREITQTVETVFVQESGGGTVTTWIDGIKTLDRFVPDPKRSDSGVSTVGWNEFVNCLNGAGVAAWLVTALSIACGAICAGTGGAGCVPCLAAAGGLTGGVFYSCAARAIFYS